MNTIDSDIKSLLELVRVGVTGESSFSDALLCADWKKLLDLARKQCVVCVAWRGIEILYQHEVNCCPVEVKLQWYAMSQQVATATRKKQELCWEFAQAVAPVKMAVLKGMDYASLWPKVEWREFGDLDIFADADCFAKHKKTFEEVNEKAKNIGAKVSDDTYKHDHINYKGLTIENHLYLTSFEGSKEGKALEHELQQLLFSTESVPIQIENLLSPSSDFTAVFMLAHAQRHFIMEGIQLRHILDWYFFLTKKGGNVDWKKVNNILERSKLKSFAVLLTQFCKTYLGLQSDVFGTDIVWKNELVENFLDDVFSERFTICNRNIFYIASRLFHRFGRMWTFRGLLTTSLSKSVWKSVTFSSVWHRKVEIEE